MLQSDDPPLPLKPQPCKPSDSIIQFPISDAAFQEKPAQLPGPDVGLGLGQRVIGGKPSRCTRLGVTFITQVEEYAHEATLAK